MMTANTKNPNTKKTLMKQYPIYEKYTGSHEAAVRFVGNCSVAIIDNILGMDEFKRYEKDRQEVRINKLRNYKVPIEFEQIIRLKQPGRTRFEIDFNTKGVKMPNDNLLKVWENQVVCMDCVEGMKQIPDKSIDLFVLSPPYDALRTYKKKLDKKKLDFDLHATGEQIYRLLKDGGICAMVIQDQTKNFAKSLTSFRTIVDWVDNIGLRLFECCIYHKNGTEGAWWTKRFRVDHEYIPIFLKGDRPTYFDKENLKIPSKHGGKMMSGFATRKTDGTTNKSVTKMINLKKLIRINKNN